MSHVLGPHEMLDIANAACKNRAVRDGIRQSSTVAGGALATAISATAGGTALGAVTTVGTTTAGLLAGVGGPAAGIAGAIAVCNPVVLGGIVLVGGGALVVGLLEEIFG